MSGFGVWGSAASVLGSRHLGFVSTAVKPSIMQLFSACTRHLRRMSHPRGSWTGSSGKYALREQSTARDNTVGLSSPVTSSCLAAVCWKAGLTADEQEKPMSRFSYWRCCEASRYSFLLGAKALIWWQPGMHIYGRDFVGQPHSH